MIKQRSSSETGGSQPAREESEPESPESIAELLEQLGPALKTIELAEKDLRIAASFDHQLRHALDRADDLSQARAVVEKLHSRASETTGAPTKPVTRARSLGETVMSRLRRRT